MHQIEMQEMSSEFLQCWQAAGSHLNQQVEGGIQSWLRAHPYPPFLEHLSFRLGNQLFFVRIEDADGKILGPGSLRGLRMVAEGCQGYACLLPMKKSGRNWNALHRKWGLIEASTGKDINPLQLVTDTRIEMTPWEVHDMAVQVVRTELEQQGYKVMSWQGNPLLDPAIWFIGDSKMPEWVVVRAARHPDTQVQRPANWHEIVDNCSGVGRIGHFASVALASIDQPFAVADEPTVPLWRGHGMKVRFNGLEC